MQRRNLAWLCGLFALCFFDCDRFKPCETSAQCGAEGMCAASLCRPLSCELTIFAIDPQKSACVPLSGCFLSAEQRNWQSCNENPCAGLAENDCIADARCQPSYVNPNVSPPRDDASGAGSGVAASCAVGSVGLPPVSSPIDGNGSIAAPGVNNGQSLKHPPAQNSCLGDNSARAYGGCRAAPQIAALEPCAALNLEVCRNRPDCTDQAPAATSSGVTPLPPERQPGNPVPPIVNAPVCFARFPLPAVDCALAQSATSCLLNPQCQPIGTRCYCPPSSQCDCSGGGFLGCEVNDRLRRCRNNADCRSGERCDNDEACITPRTFASLPFMPMPGEGNCLGACMPSGCAGMGERMCNEHPECDGGSYGTVCRPKPYCAGGNTPFDLNSPRPNASNCGCDSEFVACAAQAPLDDIRSERSLLIRDSEIIDDAAFRLSTVLGKLAPPGRVDEFAAGFIKQVGAGVSFENGATAKTRDGFAAFLEELQPDSPGVAQRLSKLLPITALINRLDLTKPGNCGEARLSYALTRAYSDGNQRMTLIVELVVPDDGHGCRSVAQRWAELSMQDSAEARRTALIAFYSELLKPEGLGQIRTNEFLNRTGKEPWELREFHRNSDGFLQAVPVAQTVDQRFAADAGFLTWVQNNATALLAENAVIPASYLGAASTEDGGRLKLNGAAGISSSVENALNQQSCAGCHLTETNSPFVHIGERLGKFAGTEYQPIGRAVLDSFLQKELPARAEHLSQVLHAASLLRVRNGLARVH